MSYDFEKTSLDNWGIPDPLPPPKVVRQIQPVDEPRPGGGVPPYLEYLEERVEQLQVRNAKLVARIKRQNEEIARLHGRVDVATGQLAAIRSASDRQATDSKRYWRGELIAHLKPMRWTDAGRLNPSDLTITGPGGTVKLTGTEGFILVFIAQRSGQIVTTSELLKALSQASPSWQKNKAIRQAINRTRKKLVAAGLDGTLEHVQWLGYRMRRSE